MVISNAFRRLLNVFEQISSCFSILSSAKFRWQILHAVRSLRAFGLNTERRWKIIIHIKGWNYPEKLILEPIKNNLNSQIIVQCTHKTLMKLERVYWEWFVRWIKCFIEKHCYLKVYFITKLMQSKFWNILAQDNRQPLGQCVRLRKI